MKSEPYAPAVGSLMYAMVATRPDISHAVGVISRFMHNPDRSHWNAVKHVFRYLASTKDYIGRVLERFNMQSAKSASTPLPIHLRLSQRDCPTSGPEGEDVRNSTKQKED